MIIAAVFSASFWGGYFQGKELGEWTDKSGSSATQNKVYLGKGIHYYPKAKIAHFKIESQSIKTGDNILITGPNTGVLEAVVEKIMVEEVFVDEATKGQECTFSLDKPIRKSDKLFKIIPA